MKIRTWEDVGELVRAPVVSAALGAALELRLFWRLEEKPATAEEISKSLGIPINRCQAWLEVLASLGLLAHRNATFALASAGRTAITEAFTPESWGVLAQEARADYPAGDDLTHTLAHPKSVWRALGREPENAYAQMAEDADFAERFTQMLYEYHQDLAQEIAETVDFAGVRRMMDLGGGSGVISMAILRRHAEVESVIVDVETVCAAGRAIAAPTSVADRLTYHAADFLQDELPSDLDLILECDVGVHSEDLFRKLRSSLNPGGRLVVVDNFRQRGVAPPSAWLRHSFFSTLNNPASSPTTAEHVQELLANAGYTLLAERTMEDDSVLIESRVEGT